MQDFLSLGFVVSVHEGTRALHNWLRSDDLVKFEVITPILETDDVRQSSRWCWVSAAILASTISLESVLTHMYTYIRDDIST